MPKDVGRAVDCCTVIEYLCTEFDAPGSYVKRIYNKGGPTSRTNMAIVDSIIAFVVSLLIGALGIYLGASILTDVEDYTYAIVTALIASIVWIVIAVLVGWIPFLGALLALLAYITVINYRYPGGWLDAIGIALIAWIATLVILYVLAMLNITTFSAIGVPGA